MTWRDLLGLALLLVGVALVVLFRQALGIVETLSWPPADDAVTAAGAQAATERFAGRPRDTGRPYAWSTAASIEPWPEGRNFFPRIFDDVRGARSSVHILMFGWREGQVGRSFAALLEEKLGEGVEVRVLIDGGGSKPYGPAKEMFTKLAAAGAQIVVNDVFPPDKDGLYPDERRLDWRQDDVGRSDHRKLYVIDGTVAWTGGAGIEDHFENGGFHDVMARVTGNIVLQAQALFLTSFRSHSGPLPSDLSKYFPAQPEPGAIPIALLQVVPGGFV